MSDILLVNNNKSITHKEELGWRLVWTGMSHTGSQNSLTCEGGLDHLYHNQLPPPFSVFWCGERRLYHAWPRLIWGKGVYLLWGGHQMCFSLCKLIKEDLWWCVFFFFFYSKKNNILPLGGEEGSARSRGEGGLSGPYAGGRSQFGSKFIMAE